MTGHPLSALSFPIAFSRLGFALHRRAFSSLDATSNLSGRTIAITGANSGIGLAAARALAGRGATVHLLCRDAERAERARHSIVGEFSTAKVAVDIVDMASLHSVQACAEALSHGRVDVLVHNAGVLPHAYRPSPDGVEMAFATSVLGPFALTRALERALLKSDDARVIFVSSGGMYLQRLDLALIERIAPYDGVRAYANAKRAQVILTQCFARAWPRKVWFGSMHPGWVDTDALAKGLPRFRALLRPILRTPAQGADTIEWLASTDRRALEAGRLYFDRRAVPESISRRTQESEAERERLFERLVTLESRTP